ncbi:MAG: M81 family metallopeptidase [Rhodobacteraceae bacterium]|nr:M81 family metallopeptidase [Paracoccaceae bacterium]
MAKIAVAGFQHETNTFSPIPTRLEDFERGGSWPALTRGETLRREFRGLNLPLSGFLGECRHETVPILWTSAEPGGYVEDNAFDRISGEIVEGIEAGGVDAVYLDLHGAMATRLHDDGEAELLRRIRARMGAELPIAVSLDLHGNLSREFFELASVVTIYRTYPHVDMAETGARAARLLDIALAGPVFGSFRQVDFLIPITAQSTFHRPAREIYALLPGLDAVSADLCLGFPPADVPCCGPTIFAYAKSRTGAERAAEEIQRAVLAAEADFNSRLIPSAQAVREALAATKPPIVIADPQDNPGAGATGDTTGLLRELLQAEVPDAVFSMIHDPAAAKAAHEAGTGSRLTLDIGGHYTEFSEPVRAGVEVVALADGPFKFTGPMYGGATANLGRIAQLKLTGTGISVVVGSGRTQNADQEMFRVAGIEPAEHRIVCVKSSVHFLADYDRIAGDVLFAEAPGANVCRLDRINYTRLRPGVRLLA